MTRVKKPAKAKALSRAERNIAWIEKYCVIPEGKHLGRPFRLRDWQKDELRRIYDNPKGTRTAIISFGRKNGKTALAAALLLLHLTGPEAVENSQLVSAAQSREQAALLFKLAAKIIRLSPVLADLVRIRDTVKELEDPELGTLYRALSAEASTAYGLNPSFIVHDELGQVKGPRSDLYEALETATGAQEEPLSVIISTQAATDNDLLSILIDDALDGDDPHTVVSLYTAPLPEEGVEDDPFSEATIRMANPAFGDFQNAKEVLLQADNARRMPSREPSYRNLVLNQRVEMKSPFVSRSTWMANVGEVVDTLKGYPVYGGLDLSTTTDLCALVLIAQIDTVWHVKPTFWLPKDSLRIRSKQDRVPYDTWYSKGFLQTTPGKSISYEFVAEHLKEVFSALDVWAIAFDRWNFKHLKPWLQKAGFRQEELARFHEFGQGFQSMTPALRTLESDLLDGRVAHGGHPVLTMCATNAVVQTDPAENRKLAKHKSSGRIDGMVALAMARGIAASEEVKPKKFVKGRLVSS